MNRPAMGGQLPKISPGAGLLLAATVGASVLFALVGNEMQAQWGKWLVATDQSVWSEFKLWQLVTTALVPIDPAKGTLDFVGLIFNALMLWLFLPTVEGWWGKKRFLTFALWMTLAGSIAGTLVGLALPGFHIVSGIDPVIFGGVVAFGVLFGERKVQFFGVVPMTGKQMVIGMSVFVGVFLVMGQRWAEGASMAGAMALAWAMTTGRFAPKLWYLKWKQKRIRRKLRIVKDDDEPKKWMN